MDRRFNNPKQTNSNQTGAMSGILNGRRGSLRSVGGSLAGIALECTTGLERPEGFRRNTMFARALVSVLAWLVAIGLLVGALEWMATYHRTEVRATGSRPVQLQQCPETCIVP